MGVKWERLSITNFRGLVSELLTIPESGLVHVNGRNEDVSGCSSNGAGKSSLAEAFLWGLHGDIYRTKAKLPNIVGPAGKETLVTLVGEVSGPESGRLVINRMRSARKTEVDVQFNGKDMTNGATVAEAQKIIDGILGFDAKSFLATSYFAGTFRFGDLNDSEHKALLERLLDIEAIERAGAAARAKVSEAKVVLGSAGLARLNIAERVEHTKELIQQAEANHERVLHPINDRIEEMRVALDDALRRRDPTECAKVDMTYQEGMISELKERIEAAKMDAGMYPGAPEVTDVDSSPRLSTAISVRAKLLGAEAEVDFRIRDIDRQRDAIVSRIRKAANLDGAPCPTCEQPVPPDHSHIVEAKYAADLGQLDREAEGVRVEQAKLRAGVEKMNRTIADLERAVSLETQERAARQRALASIESMEQQLTAATIDMEKLREARIGEEKHKAKVEADRLAGTLNKAIRDRDQVVADHEHRLSGLRSGLAAAEKGLEERREEELSAERQVEVYEIASKVFGLKGLRSSILHDVMPELNTKLVNLFEGLSEGGIKVVVNATGVTKTGEPTGKVDLDVKIAGSGCKEYADCSKGERARVDIPIMLALREVAMERRGVDGGILVLDEVLDDLDEAGVEKMMPILHRVSQGCPVFVVTHRTGVPSTGAVWTVTKSGGAARVLVE